MREIELLPKQLLVTDDVDEGTVAIYLSLLARGFREAVGKVVAAPIASDSHKNDSSYLIIEGNNRGVAYTLIEERVPVVEIANNSDINTCRQMAHSGKIPRFAHTIGSYQSILDDAIDRNQAFRELKTLDAYTKDAIRSRLIDKKNLPPYVRKIIRGK